MKSLATEPRLVGFRFIRLSRGTGIDRAACAVGLLSGLCFGEM